MRTHLAATVTIEDLKKFFSGEDWEIKYASPMAFEAKAKSDDVIVSLRAKSFMYHVHVEATDDPSDSDDQVTDEPLQFLVEFLETGSEGDEYLKKLSSSPELFADGLRLIASGIEQGTFGLSRTGMGLRRALMATDAPFFLFAMETICRYAAGEDIQKEEFDDLKKLMVSKGWKVKESQSDAGLLELVVDVSGIYTAKITVESIMWHYSFEYEGMPESKDEGTVDDPIVAFKKFYKLDSTKDAKAKKPQKVSPQDKPTVAPSKPKGGTESDKTTPPPKKK